MRHALIALAALAGTAPASSALALNPQPLPPGRYAPMQSKATLHEPPDPCRGVQGVAHARCVQRHQKLYRPGNNKLPSGSGSGVGK
jgi:hypothetical protein